MKRSIFTIVVMLFCLTMKGQHSLVLKSSTNKAELKLDTYPKIVFNDSEITLTNNTERIVFSKKERLSMYFLGKTYVLGDVDGDGSVTMSDVNMVVNYYLGNRTTYINESAADMDGDGRITMSDANVIVNKYLGSE